MYEIIENMRIILPFCIIIWGWLIIRTIRKPQSYFNSILLMGSCGFTLILIAGLFGSYIGYALLVIFLLLMLALLLVPIMLIINGIHMIKKESFSFSHILSLLLGITIAIGEIATIASVFTTMEFDFLTHLNKLNVFLSCTIFYGSCLLLSFVVYTIYIARIPHRANFDYIIIHGCGLSQGYKMTKLLSGRVDKAIEVYSKCKGKPYIIASGGQGPDEKISEAKAMYDYLIEHDVPADQIILEDQSATTMENLVNSKKIIDAREGSKKVALISSNYHIYRCLTYAHSIQLKCTGIGSKVALYFWPTAVIREFVAIFKNKKFILFAVLGFFIFCTPALAYVFFS